MAKISILLSILFSMSMSHDIAIAIFKIYEENNITKLEIRMDALDLSDAVNVDVSKLNKDNISNYLERNLLLKFDNTEVNYKLESLQYKGDHINIFATVLTVPANFNFIDVDNKCLIHIKGHSNIMQIELKDDVKDYRMHLERQHISVEY